MKVTIADLDVGNLHSLKKSLERLGAEVSITGDIQQWIKAEVLVLPGDGAFASTLNKISSHQAELALRIQEKPTLGICIGMQILFEHSDENPQTKGLGVLPGRIEKLPAHRLPHMGWNTVEHEGDDLFVSIPNQTYFYFVHSYASLNCNAATAWADYEGWFSAAVRLGPGSYAVQFHPEKSGRWGLELLDNFLGIAQDAV